MAREKGIERYHSVHRASCHGGMVKQDEGFWVKYADHLDALGEAEATGKSFADFSRNVARGCRRESERAEAAEETLAGLRERLEREADWLSRHVDDEANAGDELSEDGALFNAAKCFARAAAYTAAYSHLIELLPALQEDSKKPELSAEEEQIGEEASCADLLGDPECDYELSAEEGQ